jgi:hypothetical protein
MLVYLDDYRKTRSGGAANGARETRLKNGTYGDDDINANWSPAVLYALFTPPQAALSPDLPDDMSAIDIESFMNRIYALASQV